MPSGWDLLLKSWYCSGKTETGFNTFENNSSDTWSISVVQQDEICTSSFNSITEYILIRNFSRNKQDVQGRGEVMWEKNKQEILISYFGLRRKAYSSSSAKYHLFLGKTNSKLILCCYSLAHSWLDDWLIAWCKTHEDWKISNIFDSWRLA